MYSFDSTAYSANDAKLLTDSNGIFKILKINDSYSFKAECDEKYPYNVFIRTDKSVIN